MKNLTGNARTLVFLVLVSVLMLPVLAIETGGYEVRPADTFSPDDTSRNFIPASSASPFSGEPEPQPIAHSDLPPAVLLILAIAGICTLLAYLLKLFVSGNLPLIPGLVKLHRKELLVNASRNLIYRAIRENPGINPSEIERMTNLTNKNIAYHLNKLLDYHLIVDVKSTHGKGYFRNSSTDSFSERILRLHSKNPTERMIIATISSNPGISRKEIGSITGISGPSVSWHIARLEKDNIVERIRKGTVVHHYLIEDFKGLSETLKGIQQTGSVHEESLRSSMSPLE